MSKNSLIRIHGSSHLHEGEEAVSDIWNLRVPNRQIHKNRTDSFSLKANPAPIEAVGGPMQATDPGTGPERLQWMPEKVSASEPHSM
jgi:hypothetical protein